MPGSRPAGPRSGSSMRWRRHRRCSSRGGSSRSRFRSSISTSSSGARRRSRRPRRSRHGSSSRPTARARPRASRTTRKRRTTSSSKAAARPRSLRSSRATSFAPFWWEVRLFRAGRSRRGGRALSPRRHAVGIHAQECPSASCRPIPPASRSIARARASPCRTSARAKTGASISARCDSSKRPQQTRTTGRVDHAFVYERTTGNIADSSFRLRLAVTGNALTEVTHFVHVPESFERRYPRAAERERRDRRARRASSPGVLYGIGGCVLGVAVAAAPALPAVAARGHGGIRRRRPDGRRVARQRARRLVRLRHGAVGRRTSGCAQAGAAAARRDRRRPCLRPRVHGGGKSFAARVSRPSPVVARVVARGRADDRGARAHARRLSVRAARRSRSSRRSTTSTNHFLGWWQPSESLTDPEILGSAVPALAPIAISLQAGFMEECLFRAVPLSLAALIGAALRPSRRWRSRSRSSCRRSCSAAATRTIPGFPSYSRLVELFVPAIVWALIFLRFGLMPTILLHALFDLALMSIPLFLVDAPGALCHARARHCGGARRRSRSSSRAALRARSWGELPDALRNGAWQPPAPAPTDARPRFAPPPASRLPAGLRAFQRALPVLGIARIRRVGAGDAVSRRRARAAVTRAARRWPLANAALAARGVDARPRLAAHSIVAARHRRSHALGGPQVRLARGRARRVREAHRQHAGAAAVGGSLRAVRGRRRRARGGMARDDRRPRRGAPDPARAAGIAARSAAFARRRARARANATVRERFGLDPAALKDVGAEEKQLPARADWTFTFADPARRCGQGRRGAHRASSVAGDEVAAYGRYVHVPEAWQRAERERDGETLFVRMALAALLGIAGFVALVMAVIDWTHRRRDRARARAASPRSCSCWAPSAPRIRGRVLAMSFSTTEPLVIAGASGIAALLAGALVAALLLGLAAGVGVFAAATRQRRASARGRCRVWAAGDRRRLFVAGRRRDRRSGSLPHRFRCGRRSASSRSRCRGSAPRSRARACSTASPSPCSCCTGSRN